MFGRRWVFMYMILAIALLALAGCGGAAQPGPEPAATTAPAPTEGAATESQETEAPAAESEPPGEEATAAPESAETGGSGGELRIGIGVIPSTMDPGFDTGSWAQFAYNQIFDRLVVAGEGGEILPSVADSWELIDDTTWEFKLKPDLTFHNGEPLDAEAVKFTIERLVDPEMKSPWVGRLQHVESVEVLDPTTVRIKTTQPHATLPGSLLVVYLVPPEYYQEVGPEGFAQTPVGSGPFAFGDFNALDHLTLVAAEDSWRGRPLVDRVTFLKIPEDATRVAALQSGDIDVAWAIPPEQVEPLQQAGFQVTDSIIAQTFTLNMRTTDPDSPFSKQEVRQAINYAIDKEGLLEGILLGYGRLAEGQLVGPDAVGYNPDLEAYPYDPEMARELLAQAGYPDGFEMTIDGTQGRYPKDKELLEAIAAQLGEVGINATVNIVDASAFLPGFFNAEIEPVHDFGWQYLPMMDLDQPIVYFRSGAPGNLLSDPEVDELINRSQAALDPEERQAILMELTALLREKAPGVFLFQFGAIFGLAPEVQGLTVGPDYTADLAIVSVQ